jgi:hypothetical protein
MRKSCDERVSNQLSNDRGEHPDTSADVGGQCEQAVWVLAQGDGPTTWLQDEEAAGPSGHPDLRSQALVILAGGLLPCRTAAKYSKAYEPSCLPSRLSA